MTTTIVLAMVVVTWIVFAQSARRNTVVQTGRQAGMSRPRGK
jgi:preprotein translocase subunit SecY